jgi:mono/diheme cytochrome c family protein
VNDPSRKYRWLLLGTSLLTIGYLVAAAVRENFLAEWYRLQQQYQAILQAKATDERGRAIARDFRIELKQISLPQLKAVDRCVSCHNGIDDPRMTDVPLPHARHPGDILKNHPADRFGCTVCHQGQGQATTFHDAMGVDTAWDYPLLDHNLTQASCLACHDVEKLPREEVSLLVEGKELYQEESCGGCHRLGGRGGAMGPVLDNEGAKTKHQFILTNLKPPYTAWDWHKAHFRDPAGVVDASQMKNPALSGPQILALTVYMIAQRQRDVPESYLAPDKLEEKVRKLHPQPLTGPQVYQQYCLACHGEGSYGRWDKTFKRFVPGIRGVSLQATADRAYLEAQVINGRPGTQMPAWGKQAGGLLPEEVIAVLDFIQPPESRRAQGSTIKIATIPPRGDASRGEALFSAYCSGCHGVAGHGGIAPEIANPVFQKAASDEFIITTIRSGRRNTAMASFQPQVPGASGFSDSQLGDLLAFIRTLGRPQSGTFSAASGTLPAGAKKRERLPNER